MPKLSDAKRLAKSLPRLGKIPLPEYFGALAGRKKNFILAYINGAYTRSSAAIVAGVGRQAVYTWEHGANNKRQKPQPPDQLFIQAFEWAQEFVKDKLEREAIRRGMEGTDKGIYYKGKRIATEKEYSDTLLMFVLKKVDPAYRDKSTQDVNVSVTVDVAERLRLGRLRAAGLLGEPTGTQTLIKSNENENVTS